MEGVRCFFVGLQLPYDFIYQRGVRLDGVDDRCRFPDNTHLSQWRPLDVVLGRLQRPKDSPYFGVLVFGTGFGCGNVRLVIIPLLFPAQPMGRL